MILIDEDKRTVFIVDDGNLDGGELDAIETTYRHYRVEYMDPDEYYYGDGVGKLLMTVTVVADNPKLLRDVYQIISIYYQTHEAVVQWNKPTEINQLTKVWGVFRAEITEDEEYDFFAADEETLLSLPVNFKKSLTELGKQYGESGIILLQRNAVSDRGYTPPTPKPVRFAFLKTGECSVNDEIKTKVGKWRKEIVLRDYRYASEIEQTISLLSSSRAKAWNDFKDPVCEDLYQETIEKAEKAANTERRDMLLTITQKIKERTEKGNYSSLKDVQESSLVRDVIYSFGWSKDDYFKAIKEEFHSPLKDFFVHFNVINERKLKIQAAKGKALEIEFYEKCIEIIKQQYAGENWSDSFKAFEFYFLHDCYFDRPKFMIVAQTMPNVMATKKSFSDNIRIQRDEITAEPTWTGFLKYLKATYNPSLESYFISIGVIQKDKKIIKKIRDSLLASYYELCIQRLERYGNKKISYLSKHDLKIHCHELSQLEGYGYKFDSYEIHYNGHKLGEFLWEELEKRIEKRYGKPAEEHLREIGLIK